MKSASNDQMTGLQAVLSQYPDRHWHFPTFGRGHNSSPRKSHCCRITMVCFQPNFTGSRRLQPFASSMPELGTCANACVQEPSLAASPFWHHALAQAQAKKTQNTAMKFIRLPVKHTGRRNSGTCCSIVVRLCSLCKLFLLQMALAFELRLCSCNSRDSLMARCCRQFSTEA